MLPAIESRILLTTSSSAIIPLFQRKQLPSQRLSRRISRIPSLIVNTLRSDSAASSVSAPVVPIPAILGAADSASAISAAAARPSATFFPDGEVGDMDISDQHTVTLANIRSSLIRQEDSIIFSLIERSQFCRNRPAYDASAMPVPGFDGSLLEFVMRETEMLHGKVRRYTSPTERPFFPDAIPPLILPQLNYPKVLHDAASTININAIIWKMYFDDLLPEITRDGDDFNYGSAVTMDVLCLQALSKRIHFGAFVAEAKFQENPDTYRALIEKQDADGLMQLLTFNDVEAAVQRRVERKAATFGQDISESPANSAGEASKGVNDDGAATSNPNNQQPQGSFKIQPEVVARLYGQWIMPLTKKVQVEYLLRRLDPPSL
ncbi:hypothetical protein CLOM_g24510 [Closterium sp. NIES-68]|nr:hypothetical protein CLOM_g24510 [Closterium sp. NIES-68]GJP75511.1 hypothetical protein CLOP_g5948 [Closterium sp. NIES-67]GJP84419.1 hypothetical protein CLOP_g14477 [Closterium sp. NIES-67]